MKSFTLLLLLCLTTKLFAQPNTEIYVFDITTKGKKIDLSLQKNISNTDGYDNQPYFLAKNAVIYAGTRDGQTDIIQYTNGKTRVFNEPTPGGEYSPQKIPGQRAMSAVRLDTDGLQRLYSYTPRTREPKLLIKKAVVAYYMWYDSHTIIAADIVDENLHLVVHNLQMQDNIDLGVLVGRSLHKIPNSDRVSFIDKSDINWSIKSIHPVSLEIKTVSNLPSNTEDIAWLKDGRILATVGNTIYSTSGKKQWIILKSFTDKNLQKLSRIAVSPDGTQLAVVSEVAAKE